MENEIQAKQGDPSVPQRLLERWRKKVFECLLTNKRYEFIIQDNLNRYRLD